MDRHPHGRAVAHDDEEALLRRTGLALAALRRHAAASSEALAPGLTCAASALSVLARRCAALAALRRRATASREALAAGLCRALATGLSFSATGRLARPCAFTLARQAHAIVRRPARR